MIRRGLWVCPAVNNYLMSYRERVGQHREVRDGRICGIGTDMDQAGASSLPCEIPCPGKESMWGHVEWQIEHPGCKYHSSQTLPVEHLRATRTIIDFRHQADCAMGSRVGVSVSVHSNACSRSLSRIFSPSIHISTVPHIHDEHPGCDCNRPLRPPPSL